MRKTNVRKWVNAKCKLMTCMYVIQCPSQFKLTKMENESDLDLYFVILFIHIH
jgi:hypothetical protein